MNSIISKTKSAQIVSPSPPSPMVDGGVDARTRQSSRKPASSRPIKESEERTQTVESLLSAVERIGKVGGWCWDSRTENLTWSLELFRLLGLNPDKDKPSAQLFLSRMHPEDRPAVKRLLSLPAASTSSSQVEARVVCSSGPRRFQLLEFHLERTFDPASGISQLVGIALDITHRKKLEEELQASRKQLESTMASRARNLSLANDQGLSELLDRQKAEAALRESEERFRKIFEEGPIGMVLSGEDFRILKVNNAFCKMLGYGGKELLGLSLSDLSHPDDVETDVFFTGKMFRSEIPSSQLEKRFITRSRKNLWVRLTVSVLRDAEGKISCAIAMVENITERKKAAEQILFQASLLNQVMNGVVATDLNGNINFWNKQAEVLYQWKAEEVIGRNVFDVLTVITAAKEREKWLATIREQGSWEGEFTVKRKDGSCFLAYVINTVVKDAQGKPSGFVGVSVDITERHQAAEQLRKSREELRALSAHLQWVREKERSQISREIHDELGQALTGLKMDLAWLEHRMAKTPVVQTNSALFKKINSMSGIVDATIRQVRKITTQLRPRVLDELGLVAAIEWQAHEFQTRTGIRCKFFSNKDNIILDQDEATTSFRILQETLTNVARHSQAGRVEIHLKEDKRNLQLEVKDDGKGISEKKIDDSHSLGLLGMRERALLSQGKLTIKGIHGKGTTVTLTMPLRNLAGNKPAPASRRMERSHER